MQSNQPVETVSKPKSRSIPLWIGFSVLAIAIITIIGVLAYNAGKSQNQASTPTNQSQSDVEEDKKVETGDDSEVPATAPEKQNQTAEPTKEGTTQPASPQDQFASVRSSYATSDSSRAFLVEHLDANSFKVRVYDAQTNKVIKEAEIRTDYATSFEYAAPNVKGQIDFNPKNGDIFFIAHKENQSTVQGEQNYTNWEYYLLRTNINNTKLVDVVLKASDLDQERAIGFSYPLAHPSDPNKVFLQFSDYSGDTNKVGTIGVVNMTTKEISRNLFTFSLTDETEAFQNMRVTQDNSRIIAITTFWVNSESNRGRIVMYDHNIGSGKTVRKEIKIGYLFSGDVDYEVNHDGSKIAFIGNANVFPEGLIIYDRNFDQFERYALPSRANTNSTEIVWNKDDSRVYLGLNKRTVYFDLNVKKFTTIRGDIDNNTFTMYTATDSVAGVGDYVLFVMENKRNKEKTIDLYNAKTGQITTDVPAYVGTVGLLAKEIEMF